MTHREESSRGASSPREAPPLLDWPELKHHERACRALQARRRSRLTGPSAVTWEARRASRSCPPAPARRGGDTSAIQGVISSRSETAHLGKPRAATPRVREPLQTAGLPKGDGASRAPTDPSLLRCPLRPALAVPTLLALGPAAPAAPAAAGVEPSPFLGSLPLATQAIRNAAEPAPGLCRDGGRSKSHREESANEPTESQPREGFGLASYGLLRNENP